MTIRSSFRDPAGYVVVAKNRIFRFIRRSAVADFHSVLESDAVKRLLHKRLLVGTTPCDSQTAKSLALEVLETDFSDIGEVVEHERIPFESFPFEWPPEMLWASAKLTLEIASLLLDDQLGLKDASPYNVLFSGARPVFVDVLSVEKRNAQNAVWNPYAQFVSNFILPLLAYKYFGTWPHAVFATSREGLSPERVYGMASPLRRLCPPFLGLVTIPTWLISLSKKNAVTPRKAGPEEARYILGSLFRGLGRLLRKVEPGENRKSTWSDYTESRDGAYVDGKRKFLSSVFSEHRPKNVLDLGCNTGEFSILAAESGSRVVAVDGDPTVVGKLWRTVHQKELDVLPLVVDIVWPSSNRGWRQSELPSFIDRSKGRFDAVLFLALMHHLLVQERIPLDEIFNLAAELTSNIAVMELVEPQDAKVQEIGRGRIIPELNVEIFENACTRQFAILRSEQLTPTRRIYALKKRT